MDTDAGKDFFISYTRADTKWAEWIAWQLEEEQYSTLLQAWDFQPGMNFVLEMDQAATVARCTILVLSPDYLSARYTQPEWAVAFKCDPKSEKGALLPVRVRTCEIEGLLGAIVYIDLVDLDEVRARETLLSGVRRERGKPKTAPGFPGGGEHTIPEPQRFPGNLPPLWNVPYRRNAYFTGREDILKHLTDALRTANTAALTQPQAISGLGGIGKTQSAVEYAYRYANDYQAVLWVTAATRELLITDFVAVAGLLNLPEKDAQDQNQAVEAVKHWLQGHRDWLLILDNADDLAMVRAFVPPVVGGHLLLTTRAQAMGRVARRIELEQMEPEEGALLLLRRAGMLSERDLLEQASATERNKAMDISYAMAGLPLALDQAGAYLEETSCGLDGYFDLFQQRSAALLKRRGGLIADHPEPVATTWQLSFQKVEQADPAAADLLRLCAFLAPDAIPEQIITKGASQLGPILQPIAEDPFELTVAIEELRKYSLVSRNSNAQTITVHRLVQTVLKEDMNKEAQGQWAERAVRAVESVFPSHVDAETWSQCRRYLSQALACAYLIKEYTFMFQVAARLLTQTAFYLNDPVSYAQAESLFQLALTIREREKELGPDHPDTAEILDALSINYNVQGKNEQAEPLAKRALAIREKVRGSDHSETALSLHNLANIYRNQGKYEEALPLYRRALEIREKELRPDHPYTAQTLNNLAEIYRSQGKYGQAELLVQRALTIREKELGPNHPHTARSLNNLAEIYRSQGKYEEALPLYQRALEIREKELGPDHPYTAQTLNDLAQLYTDRSQYEQAEPLYQRALAIREQQLGLEHPDTAQGLNNLAELYHAQGKYEQAESLYQRALPICEQQLGPGHPSTAAIRENYHALVRDMKRKEKGQY